MCAAAREGQLEETLASSSSGLCQLSLIRGRVGAFVPADPWLCPAQSTAPRALQTEQHGSREGLCWDQPVCSAAG